MNFQRAGGGVRGEVGLSCPDHLTQPLEHINREMLESTDCTHGAAHIINPHATPARLSCRDDSLFPVL
jgi:hypothetical protein